MMQITGQRPAKLRRARLRRAASEGTQEGETNAAAVTPLHPATIEIPTQTGERPGEAVPKEHPANELKTNK
jgi:hypothetical protein